MSYYTSGKVPGVDSEWPGEIPHVVGESWGGSRAQAAGSGDWTAYWKVNIAMLTKGIALAGEARLHQAYVSRLHARKRQLVEYQAKLARVLRTTRLAQAATRLLEVSS